MRIEKDEHFADYVIMSCIGHGGMAVVYLAQETALERKVALKLLPNHLGSDPRFAARFEREARTIAKLDHPNIIPIYRFGIERDTPWMALRYVDGGTLESRLARSETSEGMFDLFRYVASALDYAHSKGIVHRDLKPQNVLIGSGDFPYLADFGIAKLLADATPPLTADGGVVGTPQYMAPEQALGENVGPYTDVYALAVMCFQWLTGQLPFDAETPQAILLKHVQSPLPEKPLSRLPHATRRVLERGLDKNPAKRICSASQLVSELEAAVRSGSKPVQEPRTARAATSLIVAGLVVALAVGLHFAELQPATPVEEPSPADTVATGSLASPSRIDRSTEIEATAPDALALTRPVADRPPADTARTVLPSPSAISAPLIGALVVGERGAMVRSDPGRQSRIVAGLAPGTRVSVNASTEIAEGGDAATWHFIESEAGDRGYVAASSLVRVVAPAITSEPVRKHALVPADFDSDSCLRQRDIFFMGPTAELARDQIDVLRCHAKYLGENASASLRLEAHAGEVGSAEDNQSLSELRAFAVQARLLDLGTSPSQISIAAYGSARPICVDPVEECMIRNRRVELVYQSR